ncbi:MAG TPA: DUF1631 family protein [Burkholderiaceae bacterium]|nr:DUF1631 family protein [Burkholderiaceae bacterium]
MSQIRATLIEVARELSDTMGTVPQAHQSGSERELLNSARFELRRALPALHQAFDTALAERVTKELRPRAEAIRTLAATDWQSLTLVDESEVEGQMFAKRLGQQIWHACEPELRDLASYMGTVLRADRPDQERNPYRADAVGDALYQAIQVVSTEAQTRKLLAREFGQAMAHAMPGCYAQIVRSLQALGIQPMSMTVRQVEGPGNQLPGVNSGYATLSSTRSQRGDFDPTPTSGPAPAYGTRSGGSSYGNSSGSGGGSGHGGGASRPGAPSQLGSGAALADAQLMQLLRRLTAVASRPGELDPGPGSRYGAAASLLGGGALGAAAPMSADGLTGLMAVNLIRAHREELLQASTGKLDHMVIDVVGSLFDQILSDSRVPPQMARQIARLQLPVLRVALNDATFFSSRRHPVRRFVNRIASLACAFDDFDDGPGRQFLARVRELVQEIVDGDFDQIELYGAKLAELEGFIADQTHEQVRDEGTVSTLGTKEAELRLQQRYMLQLRASLMPLALPDYLQDFLPQVWSQALVLASNRDGADSERSLRYRRAARDLVMSVQPKGSPALRKKFLMQLPPLMKALKEGMALIGWPEPAQREFFAKLLPAHAESLKAPPQSELDHNMMVKQLENIFNIPVPASEALSPSDPVPEVDAEVLAKRFTAEEAERVGLVMESAVDWSGTVDIDLGADAGADSSDSMPGDSDIVSLPGIDIDIALSSAEPPEPTRGPQLMDHVKLGFAYQMHLKDEWQKVRLAHVSAARSFFVFTRGKKHQETISMTARMLARMCETNRFRAVESAYLMERATQRARRQLAALGTSTRH